MFKSPFLVLAAVGLIAFGGYFMFTTALNKAAKEATLKCELNHKNQAIQADKEAAMDKEEVINEERKLSDADILDALISIGIVRQNSDR